MATGDQKGDIVNEAWQWLRISGITKQPTPEENAQGLKTLESMVSEWAGRNIGTGYNFEEEPIAATLHGVKRAHWLTLSLSLARILIIAKGKTLTPELAGQQVGSYSNLVTLTAPIGQTPYPSRMPIGSGNNRYANTFYRFYRPSVQEIASGVPPTPFYIDPDGQDNFGISWLAWLEGETISSSSWAYPSALTITNEANTTTETSLTVAGGVAGGEYEVVNSVETASGRKQDKTLIFIGIEK
jgi:hypothetical protein